MGRANPIYLLALVFPFGLSAGALVDSRGMVLYSKGEPSHEDGPGAEVPPAPPLRSASQGPVFDPSLAPFFHGVASGDPLSDRVILWTKVTPSDEGDVTVRWRVARDAGMTQVVASGAVITGESRDHTVKVDAAGLSSATTYYYDFEALGARSLVGRTRTAPSGTVARLRFAAVACGNYQSGYFNAYRRIAERPDLDAVVQLGDYIYEYAEGEFGFNGQVGRGHEPKNEALTLADYRSRHSFYKLDADLRSAHQQHPWLAVWDDHEFANDAWKGGAENHQAGEGSWQDRTAASVRAYREWMPVRDEAAPAARIYRSFRYGSLAEIFMLDTRFIGRDKQVSGPLDPILSDGKRTMLGADQYAWLVQGLIASKARWKLLGNQVMMAQTWPAKNMDSWEGYYPERNRLFGQLRKAKVDNLVVLTGDIHSSWAADLVENPLDPFQYGPFAFIKPSGVEFVAPSITSDNLNEFLKLPPRNQLSLASESVFRASNPHLKDVELDSHGYLLLDVNADRCQGEWYFADVLRPASGQTFYRAWQTLHTRNRISPSAGPSTPPAGAPTAAPPAPLPAASASPVSVRQGGEAGFMVSGEYWNAAAGRAGFRVMALGAGELTLEVRDLAGRILHQGSFRLPGAGQHLITVPVASASGPLLCVLRMGEEVRTRRLAPER